MLRKAGVPPKTVQLAMRHGSIDLIMETYTDPELLDLRGAIAALPLSDQINCNQPALISEKPTQLAPDSHQLSPNEPHSQISTEFPDSSPHQEPMDETSFPDTKKAPLPLPDNEAFLKRVRGIEPPPEAWEASVLPLNYTRKACGIITSGPTLARMTW